MKFLLRRIARGSGAAPAGVGVSVILCAPASRSSTVHSHQLQFVEPGGGDELVAQLRAEGGIARRYLEEAGAGFMSMSGSAGTKVVADNHRTMGCLVRINTNDHIHEPSFGFQLLMGTVVGTPTCRRWCSFPSRATHHGEIAARNTSIDSQNSPAGRHFVSNPATTSTTLRNRRVNEQSQAGTCGAPPLGVW